MKDSRDEDATIDDTAALIAAAIRKHVERTQQRADAELTAASAKQRETLAQLLDVQAELKRSQQDMTLLAAEHVELQRKLTDATAAKALAETQYQQLVTASQQLTEGLSRTLHEQREQNRPAASAKRSEPAAPPKITQGAAPAPGAASAKKKPLQFAGPARDATRVRIRTGIRVNVDGTFGDLIDVSLGGAQAVLTQMVKPNQLVRMTVATAAGHLLCRGRIVWVVYEQPGTSLSVYRMGVQFTDVDTAAMQDFMRDYAVESPTAAAAAALNRSAS
ncbi:MAG TPA: PilZ domain-containing protein [Vicinamibacterales bacterium]|nr:PilZ domain-containing protein [Vicinamibacterales bacterium]